jgi:hypothetical protein
MSVISLTEPRTLRWKKLRVIVLSRIAADEKLPVREPRRAAG